MHNYSLQKKFSDQEACAISSSDWDFLNSAMDLPLLNCITQIFETL